jgi:UDP-glucose 4-epimerase
MKVAVTGSSGFIGKNLCSALREKGWEVVEIDTERGIDIRNSAALDRACKGVAYVFHLAALPRVQYSIEHPAETHEVNVSGTLNVLLAARNAGVKKVIFAASSSAYGDQTTMPLRESLLARPQSPYALHKYIGEHYMRVFAEVYSLPTVSLRYFNVYGPGASAEGAYALVIAKFLKQRAEGKPMTITGDGTQTRDFTHVRDVVRANILAAESPNVGKGEVINIGTGREVSVQEIAKLIGGPVEHIPARLEPKHTLADNTLAKKLLGWKPRVTLEDGLAELKKLAGLK